MTSLHTDGFAGRAVARRTRRPTRWWWASRSSGSIASWVHAGCPTDKAVVLGGYGGWAGTRRCALYRVDLPGLRTTESSTPRRRASAGAPRVRDRRPLRVRASAPTPGRPPICAAWIDRIDPHRSGSERELFRAPTGSGHQQHRPVTRRQDTLVRHQPGPRPPGAAGDAVRGGCASADPRVQNQPPEEECSARGRRTDGRFSTSRGRQEGRAYDRSGAFEPMEEDSSRSPSSGGRVSTTSGLRFHPNGRVLAFTGRPNVVGRAPRCG